MNQLFEVDNIRSRAILDTIYGELQLKDMVRLAQVSRLSRSVLQEHHHEQVVLLQWPVNKTIKWIPRDEDGQLILPIMERVELVLTFEDKDRVFTYFSPARRDD